MVKFTGELRHEVLEILLEGTITSKDIAEVRKALEVKTLQEEPISFILIFQETEQVTPKSVIEEIKVASMLKSVSKIAIVSEENLLEDGVEAVSRLIPGVEVLHYPLEEVNLARNWTKE